MVTILAVVVVIIIAVSIVGAYILLKDKNTDGVSTPEDVIDAYVDAYNRGDAEQIIALDIASFLPDSEKSEYVEWVSSWFEGDYSVEIWDLEEDENPEGYYPGDASFESESEMINEIESELNVEVEDCVVYSGMIRYDEDGDIETDDCHFYLVKIGGYWYSCGLYFE